VVRVAIMDRRGWPREDWVERRVRALEAAIVELRAARVERAFIRSGQFQWADTAFDHTNSAIAQQGGSSRWLDDSGRPRRVVGHVGTDGDVDPAEVWGDHVLRADGALLHGYTDADQGWAYPGMPLHVVKQNPPFSSVASSGTFATLWMARVDHPAHEVVTLAGTATADAGTSGQLRLREGYTGDTTAVLSIPSGATGWWRFAWVHPAECGLYDPREGRLAALEVRVEGRVSGGAGSISVQEPEYAMLSSLLVDYDAATNGSPSWT
jgi:hypothetical protein